jgi:hypothetical protein
VGLLGRRFRRGGRDDRTLLYCAMRRDRMTAPHGEFSLEESADRRFRRGGRNDRTLLVCAMRRDRMTAPHGEYYPGGLAIRRFRRGGRNSTPMRHYAKL